MIPQAVIIATVLALVALGVIGLDFLNIADFSKSQEVTWTTSKGEERALILPGIPGLRPLRQEKGACSWTSENVYDLVKNTDISGTALPTLTKAFIAREWKLKEEKTEEGGRVLEFYTEKTGELEHMTVTTKFENGNGTFFSFYYRWPPCSTKGQ